MAPQNSAPRARVLARKSLISILIGREVRAWALVEAESLDTVVVILDWMYSLIDYEVLSKIP